MVLYDGFSIIFQLQWHITNEDATTARAWNSQVHSCISVEILAFFFPED